VTADEPQTNPQASDPMEPKPPESPPPRPEVWGPWATIGWTLLMSVCGLVAAIVAGLVVAFSGLGGESTGGFAARAENLTKSGTFVIVTQSAFIATILPIMFGAILLRKGLGVRDYLALRSPPPRVYLLWFLLTSAYVAINDLILVALGRPIVPEFQLEMWRSISPVACFVFVVVLAPLLEEVVFRGFLLIGLRRSRLGAWGAVVLTALLWAVIHTQYGWYEIAILFAVGLVLGYARLRHKSLLLPIAMHAFQNLVATIETAIVAGM
jgi:membrane protease YdiL (CAAX protease family)